MNRFSRRLPKRRLVPVVTPLEPRALLAAVFDPTFRAGGTAIFNFPGGFEPADSAVQSDGKLVVAGVVRRTIPGAEMLGPQPTDFTAVRINVDGSLDTAFGAGGVAVVAFDVGGLGRDGARAIAVDAQGRIVLGGNVESEAVEFGDPAFDFGVARLNPDGRLDPSFGTGGRAVVAFDLSRSKNRDPYHNNDNLYDLLVKPDGAVVMVGSAELVTEIPTPPSGQLVTSAVPRMVAAQVDGHGLLDSTFGAGGRKVLDISDNGAYPLSSAICVAVLPNGRLLLAGVTASGPPAKDYVDSNSRPVLVWLAPDGAVERTVPRSDVAWKYTAYGDIAVTSDGRVLITRTEATSFFRSSGYVGTSFGRVDAAGAPDTAFDGRVKNTDIYSTLDDYRYVALLVDGSVVLAGVGDFLHRNELSVARFAANGSQIGFGKFSFVAGAEAATGIIALPDGRTIVTARVEVGKFTDALGVQYPVWGLGVARLTAITADRRTPAEPPTVAEARPIADRRGRNLAAVKVRFTAEMDPNSLSLNRFELKSAGRDRRFNTRDDRWVPLTGLVVDGDRKGVTLQFRSKVKVRLNQSLRLRLNGRGGMLLGRNGASLDGDGDGRAGGEYVVLFGRPPRS